jgi:antibiotic biosynthesis monooxygenase (ABM) superfamily enzyme
MSSAISCHDEENPPINDTEEPAVVVLEGHETTSGSPADEDSKSMQHTTETITTTGSLPVTSGKNASLTVFARHKIQPGKEHLFEAWFRDISKLQSDKYPGFEGAEVVRPACCESTNEYLSIFRYENYDLLQNFMNSEDRRRFLEQTHEFRAAPIHYTFHSLEFLFVDSNNTTMTEGSMIADDEASIMPHRPPPRYKMVVVIFLVIWGQGHFIRPAIQKHFPDLPKLGLEALSTFVIVLLTTYLWMPLVTKYILRWWLFPAQSRAS